VSTVNIHEAKTHLSRLVEAIETGQETEIVLARAGRAVARIVPLARAPAEQRVGLARGRFEVPDDIDGANSEIEALLIGAEP
jgi:antitoxin (DNA-binding transcriptional repressor) of toxin-antitoxin stability system